MGFIHYSRMTPIRLICGALTQFHSYPWKIMLANFPELQTELDFLKEYLDDTGADKLAGLKYQGVSRLIPNLTYLSYQLHYQIGGQVSLANYKGIGSPDNPTTITLKRCLDESIIKTRRDRFSLDMKWPEPGAELEMLGAEVLEVASKFLSVNKPSEEGDDDPPRRGGPGGGGGGGPDDDDQGGGRPGGSGQDRPLPMDDDESSTRGTTPDIPPSRVGTPESRERPDEDPSGKQSKKRKTDTRTTRMQTRKMREGHVVFRDASGREVQSTITEEAFDVYRAILSIPEVDPEKRGPLLSAFDQQYVKDVTDMGLVAIVSHTF